MAVSGIALIWSNPRGGPKAGMAMVRSCFNRSCRLWLPRSWCAASWG
jgi:hypothetical protein